MKQRTRAATIRNTLTRGDVKNLAIAAINTLLRRAGVPFVWTAEVSEHLASLLTKQNAEATIARRLYRELSTALRRARSFVDQERPATSPWAFKLRMFFDEVASAPRAKVMLDLTIAGPMTSFAYERGPEDWKDRRRLVRYFRALSPNAGGVLCFGGGALWRRDGRPTLSDLTLFSLAILDVAPIGNGDTFREIRDREREAIKKDVARLKTRTKRIVTH